MKPTPRTSRPPPATTKAARRQPTTQRASQPTTQPASQPANQTERNTRQRDAIRNVLAEVGTPLSPRQILHHAKAKVENLGLATVYRTLKLLTQANLVVAVEVPGEGPRFELTGKGHHHHFYCRICDRMFEVEGCPGGLAALAPAGFSLEGHELLLFGTCNLCCGTGGPQLPCVHMHCEGGPSCSHRPAQTSPAHPSAAKPRSPRNIN